MSVRRGTCSGCGAKHRRTGQRYCHACHSQYMRRWRPARTAELQTLRRKVGLPSRRPLEARRG